MTLNKLQHRKPTILSNDQQQRMALARTLTAEPTLLLLDEPFSALDQATNLRLQNEILQMQRRCGLTTVMVNHDIGEVYRLSQRVLIIEQEMMIRQGTPNIIFRIKQSNDKFNFTNKILTIEPTNIIFTITLLINNQIIRIIATTEKMRNIQPNNHIMLLSKTFNPILITY